MIGLLATLALFAITALLEIAGCYLVFLWSRGRSAILLLSASACLAGFAYLLSLHPQASRAYAAYGGVYVATALLWGWLIEGTAPDRWDFVGASVSLAGMVIIVGGPRS